MEREFHPLSEIFPLADGAALTRLGEEIRRQGRLAEPIVLYEGKILDGRNRYRACVLTGVEPSFVDFESLDIEETPIRWLIKRNISERQLSPSQLAVVAVDLLVREEKAPYTQAQMDRAAEFVGASKTSVTRVQRIHRRRPELLDQIRTGQSSIATVSREAGFQEYDSPIPGANEYYGKGDLFREATEPLIRYLRGWRNRGFEFRHVNYKEAQARLRTIERLIDGLNEAKADLETRAIKPSLKS